MKGLKRPGMMAVAILILMSFSGAEERRGATVTLSKKDGVLVTGELLAVKKTGLVVAAQGPALPTEESFDLQDISGVRVLKKSKVWKGLGFGLLIGGTFGAVAGGASGDDPPGWFSMTATEKAIAGGILFGLTGMIIGGIGGASAGKDDFYEISGADEDQVLTALNGLGQEAKVRGVY